MEVISKTQWYQLPVSKFRKKASDHFVSSLFTSTFLYFSYDRAGFSILKLVFQNLYFVHSLKNFQRYSQSDSNPGPAWVFDKRTAGQSKQLRNYTYLKRDLFLDLFRKK